jgi:hypothetical protein
MMMMMNGWSKGSEDVDEFFKEVCLKVEREDADNRLCM